MDKAFGRIARVFQNKKVEEMEKEKKKYSVEELLQFAYKHNQIPEILFAKDTECRYVYTSEIESLIDGGEDNSIIGKTDMQIQQDPELGKKFYLDDKEIMRTGKMSHCYCEFNDNGKKVYREIAKNPVYSDGKLIGVCGVVSDVTELMNLKKKFESLTFFDTLTGVYNRNYFLKYDFNKLSSLPCSYIMCDCNDLKGVNDNFGHGAGDQYIKETANIMKNVLPEEGICVRWGGDEFLIITPLCDEIEQKKLMDKIRKRQEQYKKKNPLIGLAIGGAIRMSINQNESEILKLADERMYEDKALCSCHDYRD